MGGCSAISASSSGDRFPSLRPGNAPGRDAGPFRWRRCSDAEIQSTEIPIRVHQSSAHAWLSPEREGSLAHALFISSSVPCSDGLSSESCHSPDTVMPSSLAQLTCLSQVIEDTRLRAAATREPGCIVEVGVAHSMTSVFLLEHMSKSRTGTLTFVWIPSLGLPVETSNTRPAFAASCAAIFVDFSYNDKNIFEQNLRKCGFGHVFVCQGDAASFDCCSIPLIDVMLLDVDLDLPIQAVLANSCERWSNCVRIMSLVDISPAGD